MYMTLNRDFTLRSTTGHVISFKKGIPAFVPDVVVDQAAGIGAQASDEKEMDKRVADAAKADELPVELTGKAREDAIRSAIEKMVNRNARDDFNAASRPNIPALSEILGFKVSAADRDAAWDARLAEIDAKKNG